MRKKDEIATATSCLNKAADDEPIFVLRAKDPLGAVMVRQWAEMAKAWRIGKNYRGARPRRRDGSLAYRQNKESRWIGLSCS